MFAFAGLVLVSIMLSRDNMELEQEQELSFFSTASYLLTFWYHTLDPGFSVPSLLILAVPQTKLAFSSPAFCALHQLSGIL